MSIEIEPRRAEITATVPSLPVYRLTSEQYRRMVRANILTEDDRVELIDGWIVPKMTKNQPHNIGSRRVHHALFRVIPAGWYVAREEPLTATNLSTPEPDVMVVRGEDADYLEDYPTGADVALVVEVADASLAIDRREKLRTYAESGIPAYWLVNLPARRFEVYTEPTGPVAEPGYGRRVDLGPDDEIAFMLDGREIARFSVGDLLPPMAPE